MRPFSFFFLSYEKCTHHQPKGIFQTIRPSIDRGIRRHWFCPDIRPALILHSVKKTLQLATMKFLLPTALALDDELAADIVARREIKFAAFQSPLGGMVSIFRTKIHHIDHVNSLLNAHPDHTFFGGGYITTQPFYLGAPIGIKWGASSCRQKFGFFEPTDMNARAEIEHYTHHQLEMLILHLNSDC